jgi:diguanylate cyclase (GGDEF)-like protein
MDEKKHTVLVADDDPGNRILLKKILRSAGYDVVDVTSGSEVFEAAAKTVPDLFLLDVVMPGMDGIEVCRRLKQDDWMKNVPVIFITTRDKTNDILAGFEAGASDYVAKPVSRPELLARVRAHIRLYHSMLELERLNELALDANPLTGLPGNNSLTEAITRAIEDGLELCVIYCDMDNFKAFNDKYGFARGDEAIRFAARVIMNETNAVCGPGCFLGHIGGDDFAVIVPSDRAESVAARIGRSFDLGILDLYDARDREAGFLVSLGRKGEEQKFPLMHISMGGVHLGNHNFSHYLEVANMCAEVKKQAKMKPGSCVFFDRRKDM